MAENERVEEETPRMIGTKESRNAVKKKGKTWKDAVKVKERGRKGENSARELREKGGEETM